MNRSPLQLETYFFSKVSLEANQSYSPPIDGPAPQTQTVVLVNIAKNDPELRKWQVQVDISVDESVSEQGGPYKFSLTAIGFFIVVDNLPDEKAAQLVQISGGSLLYSASREFLMILTSRGPWPAISLSTANFTQMEPPTPASHPKPPAKRKPKKA